MPEQKVAQNVHPKVVQSTKNHPIWSPWFPYPWPVSNLNNEDRDQGRHEEPLVSVVRKDHEVEDGHEDDGSEDEEGQEETSLNFFSSSPTSRTNEQE